MGLSTQTVSVKRLPICLDDNVFQCGVPFVQVLWALPGAPALLDSWVSLERQVWALQPMLMPCQNCPEGSLLACVARMSRVTPMQRFLSVGWCIDAGVSGPTGTSGSTGATGNTGVTGAHMI